MNTTSPRQWADESPGVVPPYPTFPPLSAFLSAGTHDDPPAAGPSNGHEETESNSDWEKPLPQALLDSWASPGWASTRPPREQQVAHSSGRMSLHGE